MISENKNDTTCEIHLSILFWKSGGEVIVFKMPQTIKENSKMIDKRAHMTNILILASQVNLKLSQCKKGFRRGNHHYRKFLELSVSPHKVD